jgi:hypothetical protein
MTLWKRDRLGEQGEGNLVVVPPEDGTAPQPPRKVRPCGLAELALQLPASCRPSPGLTCHDWERFSVPTGTSGRRHPLRNKSRRHLIRYTILRWPRIGCAITNLIQPIKLNKGLGRYSVRIDICFEEVRTCHPVPKILLRLARLGRMANTPIQRRCVKKMPN